MSFRKHTAQQQAHINTFRFITGFLCMVIVVLAYCVWEARKDLWVHIPPDLRSGSTRLWWDIPPESVYAFGLYIFQQVQRWPKDGEVDYKGNLFRYAAYLTPSCKVFLEKDFEFRRNAGELRGRERTTSEIPGRGIGESNGRVIQHSINDWTVNLDMDSTEYYAGEKIKRALARYPLHVIRADVDPETNPFGLQWDCYSDTPQRIELEEPVAPTKREGGL
ncbi:PFL_4703 family integrating conjugative element protein [Pseudomonas aeruginosa]|uniref:PFL_4703 family integrating conjugative element protein n=1 Tax=Pseudomonas aeruginosa TaxID=287 RepID=UPI0018C45EFA|nr:TIGR03746 family integrating conjugative element protein [Pseudomonas aeruginosa]MBG5432581.1 TIGR03746 family integrating conjugative element protein [Pseudomonas aeruginosa]MBH3937736.1 TIGR03746 family integrating conjugative element protein [Pseudomonas aeruginosa]MBP8357407.1 TIGR03746 family integrating conjugative element protein [Pseudomonas aeruginosa]MBP8380495.1 TIGR03746 family integrating conjugative element protein [Pseudomonas aeruginosa]HBP1565605.1 TIGR03746 family integrat